MKRFIFLSFALLAWVFFELSGGTSFDPKAAGEVVLAARAKEAKKTPPAPQQIAAQADARDTVTRVSLNLASLDDILEPQPAVERTPAPEEDAPRVVLPSLIYGGSTITASSDALTADDIRAVNRTNVNVRGGPSTNFAVVSQLDQGQRVEILDDPGNGWVQMRPVDGGQVGWMADFLLTEG